MDRTKIDYVYNKEHKYGECCKFSYQFLKVQRQVYELKKAKLYYLLLVVVLKENGPKEEWHYQEVWS